MAENTGNNNSPAADTVSAVVKSAGASKTGKALLGKAAGPYGALAVSAWENRGTIFALLCALLFLLMLPVLFILMLPSLIFGNGGLDDVPENVLNDNEVIMENIAETESSIEAILREKHDAVLVLCPVSFQSITGYSLASLILASWALNCQLIFTCSLFLFTVQA